MTLSVAAQSGWITACSMPSQRTSSQTASRVYCCCGCRTKNPPPGTKPGEVFVATGSIYGMRDAGRAWYEHSKKVLEAAGFAESRLEQCLYYLHGPSGLETLVHTHVDDFLSAYQENLQEIQGCFTKSCARASFETTVRLGCVLRKDHLQRWHSHQGDTNQVNDES